jgi:hypothetical protein
LCERVYRGINRVEKRHRVAVARAVKGIPWLESRHRETLGGELVIVDPCNLMSYAMARLKGDNLGGYERNNDPRGGGSWLREKTENDLRSQLQPGGKNRHLIEPGGAWFDFVEDNKARRDAKDDPKKLAKIEVKAKAKAEKRLAKWMKGWQKLGHA